MRAAENCDEGDLGAVESATPCGLAFMYVIGVPLAEDSNCNTIGTGVAIDSPVGR